MTRERESLDSLAHFTRMRTLKLANRSRTQVASNWTRHLEPEAETQIAISAFRAISVPEVILGTGSANDWLQGHRNSATGEAGSGRLPAICAQAKSPMGKRGCRTDCDWRGQFRCVVAA